MVEATSRDGSEGYAALTTTAGFVTLDGWTTVRVGGADRATFLHNMCTADVRALAAGQGVEAFFTDVKGKIVAHTIILAGEREHWLIGVPGQAARLIAHLDRYIIREDVQLADISDELAWTLVAGPECAAAVEKLTGPIATNLGPAWAHRDAQNAGVDVRMVRCPQPWSGGLLVACPVGAVDSLHDKLRSVDVVSVGETAWQALRVESGWPLLDVDFDGTNLPQEVGRDAAAINFRKGCYLGQETVARIDALGHVNKRVSTVRVDGGEPPTVGAELLADGQVVGHVTSATWSPRLGATLALAMVRRGHNDPGARLECGGQAAEVIATPAVATK